MWIIFPLSWVGIAFFVIYLVFSALGVQVASLFMSIQGIVLTLIAIALLALNGITVMGAAIGEISDEAKHAFASWKSAVKTGMKALISSASCAVSTLADLYLIMPFLLYIVCYIATYAHNASVDALWMILGLLDIVLFVILAAIAVGILLMVLCGEDYILFWAMEKNWVLTLAVSVLKLVASICLASAVKYLFLPSPTSPSYLLVISGSAFESLIDSIPNFFSL